MNFVSYLVLSLGVQMNPLNTVAEIYHIPVMLWPTVVFYWSKWVLYGSLPMVFYWSKWVLYGSLPSVVFLGLSSRPSCVANILLDTVCKLFNQIFAYLLCLQAPCASAVLFHFQWPWPWLGIRMSVWSKTSWLHYLAQFAAYHHEIWCGVEAVQVENPCSTFEWDSVNQGTLLLLYCVKKTCWHAYQKFMNWVG